MMTCATAMSNIKQQESVSNALVSLEMVHFLSHHHSYQWRQCQRFRDRGRGRAEMSGRFHFWDAGRDRGGPGADPGGHPAGDALGPESYHGRTKAHHGPRRHHRKKGPAMLLRHIVLFQWKEETPQAKVREIQNTFCALPSKIDVIYDFEWGLDSSVEGLTEGYTHCFQV